MMIFESFAEFSFVYIVKMVYEMVSKSLNDSNDDYRRLILGSTKSILQLDRFDNAGPFRWLSQQIQGGKRALKYNSVDFIIAKILSRNNRIIDYSSKDFITMYIIGTFKSEFIPITKVAESLAQFYLEMKVMPNLITITKKEFLQNLNYSINKIRNGVLLYDREGNLY